MTTTGKLQEITAAEYDTEVLSGGKVVLDFYSTECPPCEALAAKYESLSEIYGDDVRFLKIFRQGNRELAATLGVSSSPTLLFYNQGTLMDGRLTGGIRRSGIVRELERLLPAARAAELLSRITPIETSCDTLILGGGPAGLTAGIYLTQAHVDTILVDTALPGRVRRHDSPGFQLPRLPRSPQRIHAFPLHERASQEGGRHASSGR